MTVAQGTGAGLGAVLAGVLVNSLQKYVGYSIDLTSATAIVTAMIAACGTLGHAISKVGLGGLLGLLWRGQPKPAPAAPVPPPPPPASPVA